MYAWYNGNIIEDAAIQIAADDRGWTLADGVFDTLLIQDGRIKLGVSHFKRLIRHASVIGIMLPLDHINLIKAAQLLVQKNNLTSGRFVLRTQVTRGVGPRGLMPPENTQPTILMRVSLAPALNDTPLRVVCLKGFKNERSPLSQIKSLNYLDHQLALMEAKKLGFDDAILLNTHGFIACATTANIFAKVNDQWLTPKLSDGAMDGVIRRLYIRDLKAQEKSIEASVLQTAQSVLFTNSLRGAQQIVIK